MRRENLKLVLTTSICTAIVVSALTVSVQALAQLDDDPSTDSLPRVVPYEGVLDLDGLPHTGFLDMRFSFFDAPSGGAPAWTETWSNAQQRAIQLFRGRFAVALGTFDDGGLATLENIIADADPIYLAIEVKRTNEADNAWVALSGRQRLNPVPYAMWSAKAADLDVAGAANVNGPTRLNGTLDVAGNTRLSTLNVSGATRLAGATTVDGALTANGAIANANGDVNIADGLNVSGNVSNSAGNLTLNDNTAIVGNLTVTGPVSDPDSSAVSIADDLDVQGTAISLGRNDGRNIGVNTAQRALVHGSPSDTLVINYAADFEGGTKIDGPVVTDNLDVRGTVSNGTGDLNVNDNVAVMGAMSVSGDVNLNDCRLCLLYGDNCDLNNNNCTADKAYTCVQLRNGAISPIFKLSTGSVDSSDGFKLLFLCDGGATHAATNRGNAPNEGNWPGPAN
jgi:cytoskeletal protein CcmA (bactofilin family)